mmetsp:Transcript_8586/g.18319  ORF Transcript_8586/g.18319 Transcript_8586/m.18319 type:complete len:962 (+) Transcript_8586:459-3344(+)
MPSLKKTPKSNSGIEGTRSHSPTSSNVENTPSRRSSCFETATSSTFDEAHSASQNEEGGALNNSRKNGERNRNTTANGTTSENHTDEDDGKMPAKEGAWKDVGISGSGTNENTRRGGSAPNEHAPVRTSAAAGEKRDKVAQELDVIVIDDGDDENDVEEEASHDEHNGNDRVSEPLASGDVLRTTTPAMQQNTRTGGSSNLEKTSSKLTEESPTNSSGGRSFTAIEGSAESNNYQGVDLQEKSNNHPIENADKSIKTNINTHTCPNTAASAASSETVSHNITNSRSLDQNSNAHTMASVLPISRKAPQISTDASEVNSERNAVSEKNTNTNIHATVHSSDSRNYFENGTRSQSNCSDQLTNEKNKKQFFHQSRFRHSGQAPNQFQSSALSRLPYQQQYFPQHRGQEYNQPNVAVSPYAPHAHANSTQPQSPSQTGCTVPNPPLPAIERWSEYRIDKAASIEDLESIRHRLMSLLERVDGRLEKKRVNKAILTLGEGDALYFDDSEKEGGSGGDNVDGYEDDGACLEELMERLKNEMTSVGGGSTPNGKRQRFEESDEHEIIESKRHRCFCCALCFEARSTSSLSTTRAPTACNICDEKDLCDKCISICEKCFRSVCADCLMGCDNCGSMYYCSDCMTSSNGQCAICVTKEKAFNDPSKSKETDLSKKGSRNNSSGRIYRSAPPDSLSFSSILQLYNQELPPHPNGVQNHQGGPATVTATANNLSTRTHADPQMTSNEMFSTHRFIISKDSQGKLGFTVKLDAVSSKTFVSDVIRGSMADLHGIQAGDVICRPFGGCDRMTYYLFVGASKSGTLIFDVKRPLPSQELISGSQPNFRPLFDLGSLHRFCITEPGKLGITVALDRCNEMTFVQEVIPGSTADIHGIVIRDVICKPYTNGRQKVGIYDWFMGAARNSRPLIFEVWRKEPHGINRREPSSTEDVTRDNPFNYLHVMHRARGNPFPG